MFLSFKFSLAKYFHVNTRKRFRFPGLNVRQSIDKRYAKNYTECQILYLNPSLNNTTCRTKVHTVDSKMRDNISDTNMWPWLLWLLKHFKCLLLFIRWVTFDYFAYLQSLRQCLCIEKSAAISSGIHPVGKEDI